MYTVKVDRLAAMLKMRTVRDRIKIGKTGHLMLEATHKTVRQWLARCLT